MAFSISQLGSSFTGGVSATDLYARVNQSLLSQSAGVKKANSDIARETTRLSTLGQVHSLLADFQAVTESISGGGLQIGAQASKPDILTAFTSPNAKPGVHTVEVKQLASAQVLASKALNNVNAAIGSARDSTLQVLRGGKVTTIKIDSSNNSLQGIADAFKAAGFEATIQKGALTIASGEGAANEIKIGASGDAAVVALFNGLSEKSKAQDALFTIDGQAGSSASNTVTGKIEGTALQLTKVGKTDVTVSQAPSQIAHNLANFVSAFNSVATKLEGFKGNTTAGQVISQLQQAIEPTQARALADVGVSLKGGKLAIDTAKLNAAVTADPAKVASLFTDNGKGLADELGAKIGSLLGTNGVVAKQSVAAQRDLDAASARKEKLTTALSTQAQLLANQYTQSSADALPGLGKSSSLFDFFA